MTSRLGALALVVGSTVSYHLAQRSVPGQLRPTELFAFVYAVATVAMVMVTVTTDPSARPLRLFVSASSHWAPWLLAAAVVGIEVGVLAMYRSGWTLATGNITVQAIAVVTLSVIGIAVFGERLTASQGLGMAMCLTGAWLIAR